MAGGLGVDEVGVTAEVGEVGFGGLVDLGDVAETKGPVGPPEDEDPGIDPATGFEKGAGGVELCLAGAALGQVFFRLGVGEEQGVAVQRELAELGEAREAVGVGILQGVFEPLKAAGAELAEAGLRGRQGAVADESVEFWFGGGGHRRINLTKKKKLTL